MQYVDIMSIMIFIVSNKVHPAASYSNTLVTYSKDSIMKCSPRLFAVASLALSVVGVTASAQTNLQQGFENPPNEARPRVWWHWMNGNVTETGIKLDLEWMHRIGLGGFQNFDAALDTPQVVDHRLAYMTPEWKQAFLYATKLADNLGLEEAIAASPGWSETGGPWVRTSDAMKKYVWSETLVEGGKPFAGKLMHPPKETGQYQNLKLESDSADIPEFYGETAVVAYRLPDSDVTVESLHPIITTSDGAIDATLLTDGDLNHLVSLTRPRAGEKAWIQYEFPQAQTLRAITLAMDKQTYYEDVSMRRSPNSGQTLEASDDGLNYRVIATMPKVGARVHTISFSSVTARYFRVAFRTPAVPPPNAFRGEPPAAPTKIRISEMVLFPGARVNCFQDKAGFNWQHNQTPDLYPLATPAFAASDAIPATGVVDLSSKMDADGNLQWTPPAGRWMVLRFGYSLMGVTNHPATKEATGLEVDKLNGADVKRYMEKYLDSYKDTVGINLMGARGIRYVVTDSWEAGSQNWTDNMLTEFANRRGYDPKPWLPVLAGRVVQDSEASDKFLWDLRKTIADLIAEEHYGQVNASLRERGIGQYGEFP